MNKKATFILVVGILIALVLGACAPDKQLGYQAVLTGPGGIPVANGNYTVNVKFWKGETTTDPSRLSKLKMIIGSNLAPEKVNLPQEHKSHEPEIHD